MLPDSAAGFRAHFGDDSYPYAEMIAGGTLIVLYAIEKIALGGQHSHSDVNCKYRHAYNKHTHHIAKCDSFF